MCHAFVSCRRYLLIPDSGFFFPGKDGQAFLATHRITNDCIIHIFASIAEGRKKHSDILTAF